MPSRQPPPSPRTSPRPTRRHPRQVARLRTAPPRDPPSPMAYREPCTAAPPAPAPSPAPSRPSRAVPSRAEPCRAELHRAAPHRDAGPRRAAPPLLPPGAGSARTPRPLSIDHAHPKISPAYPPAKPRPPPCPQLRMGFLQAEPRRAQARNECGFLGNEIPDACRSQISLVFSHRSHEIHEKPKEAHEVQEVASQHHASKIYWALLCKKIYIPAIVMSSYIRKWVALHHVVGQVSDILK